MAKKEMPQRAYDDPRPGYIRWCTYVDKKLLNDFKKIAKKENKSLIDAIKEAMENWTYVEEK